MNPGWLVLAVLAGWLVRPASAAEDSDFHVPVSMKRSLQSLLDQHGSIRLDADADYRVRVSDVLTVSSGQRILGGWNTRVPRIVIPGGVSRAFIGNVRSDGSVAPDVELTGGAANDDIEIVGGSGGPGTQIRVRIRDGARVNRLSLSEYGGLTVEQGSSGYVRDSTFTRLLGYWPGPQIAWQGNLREPSHGNAFLGIASITPGDESSWKNAGDLLFVGWDCESWNGPGRGSPHCFSVEGSTRVVSVGLGGGTAYPDRGGALLSVSNVPAFVSWFAHPRGGRLEDADVLLRNVDTLLSVQPDNDLRVRDGDAPSGAVRVRLLAPLGASGARVGSSTATGTTGEQRAGVVAAMSGPVLTATRAKPTARAIDDPLGPSWRTGLASRPDSSARIQADIDDDGVAALAPGIYYLDRPLRLGRRGRVERLIGQDRDRVVLVAKGAFPVVAGRGYLGGGSRANEGVVSVGLSGLTLYGGTYGVHWSAEPDNFGPAATVAWSQFSDLKFLRQSVAGVNVAGINGIDSNFWYRVDFADVPVAIRGNGSGAGLGMSYADKQHFLDCQYQRVADVVWYWTSDRPSGGEVWKDNVYLDVGRLTRTRGANNLLWINSVMENVTGDVAIHVTDGGSTATYYFAMLDSLWRGRGPGLVTDTQSLQVGTMFIDTEFAQVGGSIVASAPDQSLFGWGSRITGSAAVGAVRSGVFVDSRLERFDQALQIVEDGQTSTLSETR